MFNISMDIRFVYGWGDERDKGKGGRELCKMADND